MLRLTDTEYEIVAANAKAANLSLAEYARKQIMNKRVIVKYELVADLPELKKQMCIRDSPYPPFHIRLSS